MVEKHKRRRALLRISGTLKDHSPGVNLGRREIIKLLIGSTPPYYTTPVDMSHLIKRTMDENRTPAGEQSNLDRDDDWFHCQDSQIVRRHPSGS